MDSSSMTASEATEPRYAPPPVTGYRKLSQAEVDLMNEIKANGDEMGALVAKLRVMSLPPTADTTFTLDRDCVLEGERFIKTGLMWLVRAVAQPTNF